MKFRTLLGVAFVSALMVSCGRDGAEKKTIHSVILTEPQCGSLEEVKTMAGSIEEAREISVGFKVPGQISHIAVKEGDYVKAGQLIAMLDDKDVKLELEATQIQYDQLKREVDRLSKLKQSNSITGNDYDKASSGLAQLSVALQGYKNKLSYTNLYAPTNGYVQSVNFEASEMVNAGTPIFTILDTKQMEVVCNIPASLYMEKEKIKSITCSGRFSEGKPVKLQIISITPKADASQLYKMHLAIVDRTKKTVSGQNVEVKVSLDNKKSCDCLTVPMASVVNESGVNFVMVYNPEDSTVVRKAIELDGMKPEGRVAIKSGLNGSEQIVKAGASRLIDGEKVRVVGEKSDSNIGDVL